MYFAIPAVLTGSRMSAATEWLTQIEQNVENDQLKIEKYVKELTSVCRVKELTSVCREMSKATGQCSSRTTY